MSQREQDAYRTGAVKDPNDKEAYDAQRHYQAGQHPELYGPGNPTSCVIDMLERDARSTIPANFVSNAAFQDLQRRVARLEHIQHDEWRAKQKERRQSMFFTHTSTNGQRGIQCPVCMWGCGNMTEEQCQSELSAHIANHHADHVFFTQDAVNEVCERLAVSHGVKPEVERLRAELTHAIECRDAHYANMIKGIKQNNALRAENSRLIKDRQPICTRCLCYKCTCPQEAEELQSEIARLRGEVAENAELKRQLAVKDKHAELGALVMQMPSHSILHCMYNYPDTGARQFAWKSDRLDNEHTWCSANPDPILCLKWGIEGMAKHKAEKAKLSDAPQ